MTGPRKLGLHQVYPDPHDVSESNNKDIDIIAIHGLDTHAPKTWVAWKKSGDPNSGEVHWLQDNEMLPSVVQNARIFTYDWNASFDKDAEIQTLAGHANGLLNKIRNLRRKDNKAQPIIFVASCFGGLLLSKALHRASHIHSKYLDILKATFGIVFLGTPFRGSHESFYTATQLRLAVAMSMGAEASGELLKYLQNQSSDDDQLEGLFQSFCEMVDQLPFKIHLVCFYETQRSDFSKVVRDLPPEFRAQHEKNEASGILVPAFSASLPGCESIGLSVRHAMLNKYASPEDESFKTVSSTLLELSIEAQKEFRSKLSLANDPIGLQIANWLKSSPVKIEHDSQIDTLVFKARMLEKLGNSENLKSTSILAKVTSKARRDISQNAQGLSLVLNTTAGIAEKPPADAAFASEIARKTIYEMRSKVEEFCQSARDGILLDPQINLEDAIEDEITLAIDAKSDIDLRQCVLETSDPSEDGQLPNTRITYVPGQSSGTALARLRYGYYQKKYLVIVESFPYTPTSGTTDMPPDTLIKTRRMIERLSHPNRTSKHVLPCFGYIQDRYRKQIEVVFSVGEGYDVRKNPTSLYDLYSKMNRVPLGLRFKLAHSLATAVEGLHRVGWVHEELKSKNFILLERTNPGTAQPGYLNGSNLDFDNPYLLGFKWSRPADAETDLRSDFSLENNAYRHPDRWGKPVRFTKAHDIYSLGVIFFELVQWKPVTYRFKILEGQPLGSEDLKKEILATTQRDVSHMAGQSIADVIETCLNFDTLTKGLDQFEAHCIFKEKILGVVTRLARADI